MTWQTQTSAIAVSVSPDGLRLASAGRDQKVTLWDMTTGRERREVRTFTGHTGEVYSVAFSFDGKWIVTGGEDKTARIWETATGREIRKLVRHTRGVQAVGFSPDGRRVLTGSADNTVNVWDRESGEVLFTVAGDPCAFSPNGKQIVTGVNNAGESSAILWDATDEHELIRCKGHTDEILVRSIRTRRQSFRHWKQRSHRKSLGGIDRSGTIFAWSPRSWCRVRRLFARWPLRCHSQLGSNAKSLERRYRPGVVHT
jgi:WD40 repeat protein